MAQLKIALRALAAMSLAACGQSPDASDKSSTDAADFTMPSDVPLTTLVATHAIEIPVAVKALGYIPDFDVPWSADILIVSEAGDVVVTDVEGTRFDTVKSNGDIVSIAGIPREGRNALFLATNTKSQLLAFENDGDGFKSLPISYDGQTFRQVCQPHDLTQNSVVAVTAAGIFEFAIEQTGDAGAVMITQTRQLEVPIPDNVLSCTGTIARLGIQTEMSSFTVADDGVASTYTGGAMAVLPQTIVGSVPDTVLITHNTDGSVAMRYDIADGLSIGGVRSAKVMMGSQGSLGGPFSSGFIAIADADAPRLVIMSLSYLKTQMGSDATSTP